MIAGRSATEAEDNLAIQKDEIETLSLIYGDDCEIISNQLFTVSIPINDLVVLFTFEYPWDYPSRSPPRMTIQSDWLSPDQLSSLSLNFLSMFEDYPEQSIIFKFLSFVVDEWSSSTEKDKEVNVGPQPAPANVVNIEEEEEIVYQEEHYSSPKNNPSAKEYSSKPSQVSKVLLQAADIIKKADYVLIIAGAGFGIDSGLPDYRGSNGFWNDYPPARNLGLPYSAMATPKWYHEDPALAWGFAGHLINMYRKVVPHEGFEILKKLCFQKGEEKYFVFTSNVDGEFQKVGFPDSKIYEVHGTVHYLQCIEPKKCKRPKECWPLDPKDIPAVDADSFRALGSLPKCKFCGKIARLNVSLFNDPEYVDRQSKFQKERFAQWLMKASKDGKIAMIEVGCGTSEHSIRLELDGKQQWKAKSGEWKMGFGVEKKTATLISM